MDLLVTGVLLLSLTAAGLFLGDVGILRRSPAVEASVVGNGTEAAFTLVIDPGHGGLDGGATAEDGTRESFINLQICLRMRDLSELLGLPCRLTRAEETLDYPQDRETVHEKKVWDQKRRVDLINETPGGVLLSVHQNRYPDPRPSGSQVLYAGTEGSAELAEKLHDNLIAALCPENRRVAAPVSDSIYLMKRVNCPAVLVECGFLSNPGEAERLKSGDYQTALAAVLVSSVLQYRQSLST